MGQKPSKRVSNTSTSSLLTTYPSPSTIPSTPTSPLSDITPPAPPRSLNRLSEIIDPRTLLREEDPFNTSTRGGRSAQQPTYTNNSRIGIGIVHSPSGNSLGAREFMDHPNRPLAMWERQERVLQATREGMERFEAESRAGTRVGFRRGEARARRKRGCCGCCGR